MVKVKETTKPIKQGKQKYDFPSLKAEFMKSDYLEVKKFITDKGIAYNQETRVRTKGWTKEKKIMKEKIAQRAIAKSIEKQANQLSAKIPLDRLIRMKSDFFDLIDQAIDGMQSKENVDIEKVIKGLNAIKTELGEPTTVAKNENENRDRIESISIVIGPQHIDNMGKND